MSQLYSAYLTVGLIWNLAICAKAVWVLASAQPYAFRVWDGGFVLKERSFDGQARIWLLLVASAWAVSSAALLRVALG